MKLNTRLYIVKAVRMSGSVLPVEWVGATFLFTRKNNETQQ